MFFLGNLVDWKQNKTKICWCFSVSVCLVFRSRSFVGNQWFMKIQVCFWFIFYFSSGWAIFLMKKKNINNYGTHNETTKSMKLVVTKKAEKWCWTTTTTTAKLCSNFFFFKKKKKLSASIFLFSLVTFFFFFGSICDMNLENSKKKNRKNWKLKKKKKIDDDSENVQTTNNNNNKKRKIFLDRTEEMNEKKKNVETLFLGSIILSFCVWLVGYAVNVFGARE